VTKCNVTLSIDLEVDATSVQEAQRIAKQKFEQMMSRYFSGQNELLSIMQATVKVKRS
jgi:hypothetical protein